MPLLAVARDNARLPEVSLEFLNGPSEATAWPVRRVMSLIGSAHGCKFRLTDASVSRFHASLLRTSLGLWIVDLLGQDGISVNDVPRRFSHLAEGDRLRIGRYLIRVTYKAGSRAIGNDSARPAQFTQPAQTPRREGAGNGLMLPDRITGAPAFATGSDTARMPEFPLAMRGPALPTNGDAPATLGGLSVSLTPPDLNESTLVPLVNQFGLMQQQMFDQFQQAMAMMVQMFGTMHRDQMAVIREELDRLNELTEEFHALRAELAGRTPDKSTMASGAPESRSTDFESAGAKDPKRRAPSSASFTLPAANGAGPDQERAGASSATRAMKATDPLARVDSTFGHGFRLEPAAGPAND